MERKPVLKVSPELGDGDSWSLVEEKRVLLDLVGDWFDEFASTPGERFSVEVVAMSQEEIDALPEL